MTIDIILSAQLGKNETSLVEYIVSVIFWGLVNIYNILIFMVLMTELSNLMTIDIILSAQLGKNETSLVEYTVSVIFWGLVNIHNINIFMVVMTEIVECDSHRYHSVGPAR